ncbi:endonuclease III domain-containing protein [Pseudodesulfovibrio sp. zrk46]|uniref:endonuclease III domain-containing protein n=1 Tax=Pseudodesulfovibrio sp. zrk46 TaxID=2725288 RepID=UPI0014490D6F|nr:endonuclease III domain-containing protein [Pseudodesulfovibrio sp. zrk46]QJB57694.1 endonuclease III domain-containing protein [Pseudodesulfovibrio sp. zrk46]
MGNSKVLIEMYETMSESLGPSNWWPGDSPFEIAVGAILVQNTNWANVEKAIDNLKSRHLLSAQAMHEMPSCDLVELIRPAGYFNIKAKRLVNFLEFLRNEVDYEIEGLKVQGLDELRPKMLEVNGIGPETADAILLYALEKPSFVVDAYTFRMMGRHGLAWENMNYHDLQALFMDALPEDVALYNEYHALIVRVGKEWCKKKCGLCENCPLNSFLN